MAGANKHRDRSHRSYRQNLSNAQWFWRGADLTQQIKVQTATARKSWFNRFLDLLKDEKADEAAMAEAANE